MKKTKKIFNFILCLLPLFVFIFFIIKNQYAWSLFFENFDYNGLLIGAFENYSVVLMPLVWDTFLNALYEWVLNTFFNNVSIHIFNTIFGLFAYYFWVQFIGLLFDVLLYLVEWARKWLNNTFGKEN